MSEKTSQQTIVTECVDEEMKAGLAEADSILSAQPLGSSQCLFTQSDSMSFLPASDSILESPTLIEGLRLVLKEFESDTIGDELEKPATDNPVEREEKGEMEGEEIEKEDRMVIAEQIETVMTLSADIPEPFSTKESVTLTPSDTDEEDKVVSCLGPDRPFLPVVPDIEPTENIPMLLALQERASLLTVPGPDASPQQIAQKLEDGLRFLNDLAHVNSRHDADLRHIHDAYFFFAHALFRDIGEQSDAAADAADAASLISGASGRSADFLEERRQEIYEQESLLEREILHYKATKRELERVTERLEEAARTYRPPDALEDLVIPEDVRLSSSSEYVAEIGGLQTDILRKQEQLKQLYSEIRERYLPKELVDSICESHRLSVQTLKEIEEEIKYLKECLIRLGTKYEL